ncbi:hypothetical protein [Sporosalibacterium faouarense]|uniref:hypothetical protein n=1 Tax=Sporosalibacterium faouarense TaxID=516123 RepID=UPI00141C0AC8|nr:hypothetical protein [Sporosalibacterium faouarense]MTI48114.1 hypothetical protein [Bacillota bacterium]
MSNFNDDGRFDNNMGSFQNQNNQYGNDVNYTYNGDGDEVSIGTWVLILIGTGIPIVNIIVLLFLAFGSSNTTLKNYGKAGLIMACVAILLVGCANIIS